MRNHRFLALAILLLTVATDGATLHAQRTRGSTDHDPRWISIRRVFGQDGEVHDGYFRINLPRSDLTVRIGGDALESPFELTSYIGFAPVGKTDVLAMGEYVLRDDEVANVLSELHRQGISTPALHNHLIGEAPRIMYIHVMARGPAESVASKLKAAVVFQQLGNGRAACGGELFLLPNELDAVARTLHEHGLHVTAIHNHMVEQTPHMYWMHWYGTGDAATLARGVAAALQHTNGARKSVGEE